MSNFGFVYVLANEYMPNVYKIGCTERSPHTRAEELSKHTGVPAPFRILCYIEIDGFQEAEKALHQWMSEFRISDSREFFHGGLRGILRWMWFNPKRVAFCDVTLDRHGLSELAGMVPDDICSIDELPDPWNPPPKVDPCPPAPLALVSNGVTHGADDDVPF
jgi:hypothetical protein